MNNAHRGRTNWLWFSEEDPTDLGLEDKEDYTRDGEEEEPED